MWKHVDYTIIFCDWNTELTGLLRELNMLASQNRKEAFITAVIITSILLLKMCS